MFLIKHHRLQTDIRNRKRDGTEESEGRFMKINNIGNSGINPYKRSLEKMDQLNNAKKPLDKVEISSAAKGMQETSRITQEREAKVAELKKQVESGNYKVDSHEIAKNLLKYYKGV
jgi:negative regulator of flagellin synthesis FlgM